MNEADNELNEDVIYDEHYLSPANHDKDDNNLKGFGSSASSATQQAIGIE